MIHFIDSGRPFCLVLFILCSEDNGCIVVVRNKKNIVEVSG